MSDYERIKQLSDQLLLLQEQEKVHADNLRRVKSAIAAGESELVTLMLENKLSSIGGRMSVAELEEEKIVPRVTDWATTHKHIQQTGDFDLLHRRISLTAFRERLNAGVVVPGIEARPLTTVKISQKG